MGGPSGRLLKIIEVVKNHTEELRHGSLSTSYLPRLLSVEARLWGYTGLQARAADTKSY